MAKKTGNKKPLPSKVLTHEKFGLSKARLKDLKKRGTIVEDTTPTDDPTKEFDAPDPKYGEGLIGKLTPEEGVIYREFNTAMQAWEKMNSRLLADALEGFAGDVRETSEMKGIADLMQDNSHLTGKVPEKDLQEFCRLERKWQYMKNMLYFHISERLGYWEYILGIRSKGRIVTVSHKINNDRS